MYDTLDVLLGAIDILGVEYQNETAFLGIEATGSDDIGRINLWDGNVALHFQGADDISVFAQAPPPPPPPPTPAPESGTLALLALGVAAVGARRRARAASK